MRPALRVGLCLLLLVLIAGGAGLPASAPAAILGRDAQPVPNTSWDGLGSQLAGPAGCAAPGTAGCTPLGTPASPADDGPASVALGRPGGPEDDLAAALRAMAAAPTAAAAQAARSEALAILAGDPLPGRVYDGIPLLNWNPALKVRRVPAAGTVTVTEVRTPGQSLSDTWLLDFEDPAQPYTIRYRISEVGGVFGGEARPTPLLTDGLGGLHATIVSLVTPALPLGTRDASRFTAARGLPVTGGREQTRLATQEISVRMPPPGVTRGILSPAPGGDGTPTTALAPATPERLEAVRRALGVEGAEASEAERAAAIARLAPTAPERLLWDDLQALPVSTDPAFLTSARSLGAQDGALVAAMRTRVQVPSGVATDATADVTVVLQNNEAYVSRGHVRLPAGEPLRVEVVNRDRFAHRLEALDLHGRQAVFGAEDWGRFDWAPLTRGDGAPLGAGQTRTLVLAPAPDAFALTVGDPDAGDQAVAVVDLDRGPRIESVRAHTADGAQPLHQALDPTGALWVGLAGIDAVVRIEAGDDLSAAHRTTVLLPGGRQRIPSDAAPLAPADVTVDAHGIVWVTLTLGNAVARIDPALVRDGTTSGVRLYPLTPCDEAECRPPFPPTPGEPATRQPLQMQVTEDATGTAQVWFTEMGVDRIGLLRVAADGSALGQTHFTCGCRVPLGLALDGDGAVWFTEGVDNRIGRLVPDATEPSKAAGATLRHFVIPSAVAVEEPELAAGVVLTSNPHSVEVDARGRVWFTESATGRLGLLDPDRARAGTSDGIAEFPLPPTPFGSGATPADLTADRAGSVFWTDEYGDAVGIFDARGPQDHWHHRAVLRPAARRSLTDSPLVTPAGDLWFVESGADLLTRVSGVSAGAPLPAAAPAVRLGVDDDTITAEGLADADAATVTVLRDGRPVAAARAVVAGGAFSIAAGDWQSGEADRLRAGDRVTFALAGAYERAGLDLRVADLAGRLGGGALAGHARSGEAPAAGQVTVAWDGARTAAVDPVTASWQLPAPAGATAGPTSVAWTHATPAVRTTTVVAIAQDAAGSYAGATAPGGAGGGASPAATPTAAGPDNGASASATAPAAGPDGGASASGTAPAGGSGASASGTAPAGGNGGATRPPQQAPAAGPPRPPASPATSPAAARRCPATWLSGPPARPAPAFLGRSVTALRACLGAPAAVHRTGALEELRYPSLTATARDGRVVAVALTGPALSSASGGLRVGAPRAAVARALPLARNGRAVIALGNGRAADVRIRLTADGTRVARIDVRETALSRLDATGRALLRAAA